MGRELLYVNGQLLPQEATHLSAIDRGFTLGDGVFDTLRAVGGRLFRLEEHLNRLHHSATTVGLPLPMELSQLGQTIYDVLAANSLSEALVRVTLSRGIPTERGLMPPATPSPSLVIHAMPFGGHPQNRYHRGFAAAIVGIRRNETSPLSYIKSCNYLDSVLARRQAGSLGADEAIFLNSRGSLACGASSNLFLVSQGTLVTPSLDCGVLDGVTRRAVLELAAGRKLECRERTVTPEELAQAKEAFVTNTAIGVMPLVAVDGRPVGLGIPGPITLQLHSAYEDLLQTGL